MFRENTDQFDTLTDDEADRLPFGLIRLNRVGRVLLYNQAEADLAGFRPEQVVGRNFFIDIAPCTRVQEFYATFLEGVAARSLDAIFPFQFQFRNGKTKEVMISMFYSTQSDSVWVVVERPATPAAD